MVWLVSLKYSNFMVEREVESTYKVLVFEYITGGGFAQQELPSSLAKEGAIMLNALVNELASFPHIQITVMVDWRFNDLKLPQETAIVKVLENQCVYELLADLINNYDFVWPVAPEIDGALYKITNLIEQFNIKLLNSSSSAILLCSDKLATVKRLVDYDIATLNTLQFNLFSNQFPGPWVVKPKDGAGCLNSYYIANNTDLFQITKQIDTPEDYVIQPYLEGASLSLSCLFRKGEAWLLCCNQQHLSINNKQFSLDACIVNIKSTHLSLYQKLIDQIAIAIPGLSAYVGIDIIHPEGEQPKVLEINLRLTTSYVGINQAIGFNIASAVIEMSKTAPTIIKTRNEQYSVLINE
jgi:predicted ATP-grasp superfamily ATP-dependent carboligase